MSGNCLLNKYKLVTMRKELIYQLDDVEANKMIDEFYSQGVINLERKSRLNSVPNSSDRLRGLLDHLERRVDLEDRKGCTEIFDLILKCLEDSGREDLAGELRNAEPASSQEEEESDLDDKKSIVAAAKGVSLTDKILSRIVRNIGSGWKELAHGLGIKNVKIEQAIEENPNNTYNQKFQVFAQWKRNGNFGNGTAILLETLASIDTVSVEWEGIQKIFKVTK